MPVPTAMAVCLCCQMTEKLPQAQVESIQAKMSSERMTADSYWFTDLRDPASGPQTEDKECAVLQKHQQHDIPSCAERRTEVEEHPLLADQFIAAPAVLPESVPHPEPRIDDSQKATGGIKLTFKRPNGIQEDVRFYSSPLCVRFSKSLPLVVTAVGMDYAGSRAVNTSWTLTHVDDEAVHRYYEDAADQVRLAIKSLPARTARLKVEMATIIATTRIRKAIA